MDGLLYKGLPIGLHMAEKYLFKSLSLIKSLFYNFNHSVFEGNNA
jgi:hypothetical protein